MTDAEICGLICPRPLMIDVGRNNQAFSFEGARLEADRTAEYWRRLGVGERFVYREFGGGHEFDGRGAYEFVKRFLE